MSFLNFELNNFFLSWTAFFKNNNANALNEYKKKTSINLFFPSCLFWKNFELWIQQLNILFLPWTAFSVIKSTLQIPQLDFFLTLTSLLLDFEWKILAIKVSSRVRSNNFVVLFLVFFDIFSDFWFQSNYFLIYQYHL